jgi:hypothetical protein
MDNVTQQSSGSSQGGQGQIIASILAALQNGVVAINTLTKNMSAIFPSSS